VRGTQILLQHRAPWVHNGDTWGIPGGARDSHESTIEGAFREAVEETGIDTALLTPLHVFCDDHGSWKYETVIARAEVDELTLHPSFEKSWPALKGLIKTL